MLQSSPISSTSREHNVYQAFLDAFSEPALLLDRSYVVLAANRAMTTSLKKTLTEVVGANLFELLPRKLAERRFGITAQAFDRGEEIFFDDFHGERHFQTHLAPVRDESGEVWALAVYATEITESKKIEASLKESEARYRQILETCIEGVWQIDHESRTTYTNEQMASMLGYSVEEMLGRTIFDFMDAEAIKTAASNVERRRRGVSEHHEFCLRHKDGHDVWTVMSTGPVKDESGVYRGAIAFVTDISRMRQLEDRMLSRQKLESLGLMAGGIAHDFNNILAGVLGNAELLSRRIHEDRKEERELLKEIRNAAGRAAELTAQLLAYSGRGRIVPKPLSLNRTVEEAVDLVKSTVARRAQLYLHLAKEVPLVEGDASQLRQVLINLITNASEAVTDDRGTVTVSTDTRRLEGTDPALSTGLDPGRYVSVRVEDDGCGIEANAIAKIFDPFFSTKFTGRGLGLAAVQGIVRSHKGAVRVESQVGSGTVFEVLLPARTQLDSVSREVPHEDAPTVDALARCVLVVDDEGFVRRLASRLLGAMGLRVIEASGGKEALVLFEHQHEGIDFVLLDITMPGMSGAELFSEMRRIDPKVRVIFSSGFAEDDVASGLGIVAQTQFLQKPYSASELEGAVSALLGNRTGP